MPEKGWKKCDILGALENGVPTDDLLIDGFEFISCASETGKVLTYSNLLSFRFVCSKLRLYFLHANIKINDLFYSTV